MRQSREPGRLVFVVDGTIDRADVPVWCARLHALLESSEDGTVICDVGRLARVDAAAVDALARFQLLSRRFGRRFRVRRASPELRDLLALVGLSEIVAVEAADGP